jgi:PAS domain S-box-containing protein
LFALSLVALTPILGLKVYDEIVTRRTRAAEVRETALRSAQQAWSELDRIVEGARSVLVSISKVDSVQALDTPRCVAHLAKLQPEMPHLVSLAALDLKGRVRCRQELTGDTQTYADGSYFQDVVRLQTFATGEFTDGRVARRAVLPVAAPLWDNDRKLVGVLAAAIDLKWLGERLRERGLPPNGSITVADKNGTIIAREPFPERFVGTRIPDTFRTLLDAPTAGAVEVTSQDGTQRVLGYVPVTLPLTGLYVSAGLSSEASFAAIDRATQQNALVIAAGAILALLGAWLLGRRFIHHPVQRLLETAESWRSGNLEARTGLNVQGGELDAMGAEFDRVVAILADREGALRASEGRFRELADSAPVMIWMSGPDKEGVYFNKPWLSFTGRPLEQELGEGWLDTVHPADREALKICEKGFAERRPFQAEFRMRRHDGEWRWLLDKGVPRFGPGGEFQGFIGSCLDITERKRAEQRQKLLVNELNHRVKNTLTTVQSLAAQTLRASDSMEQFGRSFESRLLALSKTHDILTAERWEGASLTRLIEHEVAPYLGSDPRSRLVLRGENLQLPPRYALSIGLSLHELATNAVKYGALSLATGRVEVAWHVEDVAGTRSLHLVWSEHGGPLDHPPSRRGFGSRLVERSIRVELQGAVEPDFAPTGLVVTLRVPLPEEKGEGAEIEPFDVPLGRDAA